MKRDLPFNGNHGVLAEALGIDLERSKRCEELVELALKEKRSIQWIIETANETLDMTDAEWTTFMYTLGWWDHARRG